jgi:hypothetical protein
MITRQLPMKKLTTIFIAITSLCSVLDARSEEIVGTGVGNRSCAEFAKLYRNTATPNIIENIFFSWAQGYMAGWNVALSDVQKELTIDLSTLKTDEQKKYLRDFCDKHPLKNYMDGVMELMSQIKYLNAKKSH